MLNFQQLHEARKRQKKLNGITITSLEDFLKESVLYEAAPFLGATVRPFPHADLQSYLGRVVTKTKDKKDKYEKPHVHGGNVKVADERGGAYDLDHLRSLISSRPPALLKQNEKMVHSDGTSSVFFNIGLPALKGLAVNEKTGEFVIVDTCPGAGACKTYCYAMKGGYVQWKASSLSQTRVLNFLMNDPDGFKAQLSRELMAAQNKFGKKGTKIVVRWHDAGDFFSPEYLNLAYDVARHFPNIDFYAYTKIASVAQSERPANFKINFSQGAQPSQERQIDFKRTKHSKVVPKELFFDLIARQGTSLIRDARGRMQFRDAHALEEFKKRMAHKYALQLDTIITYDHMMNIPHGNTPHWNVIVMPGDGDESANRHDVIGTYLLFH